MVYKFYWYFLLGVQLSIQTENAYMTPFAHTHTKCQLGRFFFKLDRLYY